MSDETIQVDAGDLIRAMKHHHQTVLKFEQSVAKLDDALANTMQFLTSWIERLESLHGVNGGVRG
jgi:hypothetical protein